MTASNFSSPQFQASPAKQVQAPVDNVPAQQNGFKGTLTGLAQLGMGIATDDPVLTASGASTVALGPKAGKLAGTLANAAGGGSGTSGVADATTAAGSAAQATSNKAASITGSGTSGANSADSTSGGASSAPANAQANAGGLDPLAYVALMQALGKSSPNPSPQNPQSSQGVA